MENKTHVKQVNAQNKEPKIVTLGKVSSLTLGIPGGNFEGANRPINTKS